MPSIYDAFANTLIAGLTSQSITSCLRWAEKRRVMSGDFGGPYSTKYHPWCRALHDSKAMTNSVMKGAQTGVTEVAINQAFYSVDIRKKDVLYVLPTALNASDFSKARFNTALKNSPYLDALFTDTNSIGLKQAGGTNLYIRGSRGDSNLKSIPVSILILDEVDEMDQKQIWLALERLSGHIEKLIWAISTPTIPKRGIHKLFLDGTQEHFMFPCPHCGRKIELMWPDSFKVYGDVVGDPECAKSHLICSECKKELKHHDKPDFLGKAAWYKRHDADDHRSFYVNQLYSYTVQPREIANAYHRGLGDDAASVEFYNSKLGLPFIPIGGVITDEEILAVVRDYSKEMVRPTDSSRLITMGVDQGKWNHACVVEWFTRSDGNDLNAKAFAKLLWEGKVPGDNFSYLDDLMREWQVIHCVVDADPQINDARRFGRRYPGFVTLCRYRSGCTNKEIKVNEDSDVEIATVDRTNWLDATMGRIHTGRIEFPRDVSTELKEHLKALTRTYEKDRDGNPKAVYINSGADHFAHALNYAEIALPLAYARETGRDIAKFL